MDNNYYSNFNGSNNNINSENNSSMSQQNQQQEGINPGPNPYGTGMPGNASGYAYNNYSGNAYSQQNGYNPYQQPGQTQKVRKPKNRKHGFGAMIGKCAAVAVVFGLVAGSVFTGISYVGTRTLGITSERSSDEQSSSEQKSSEQKVSVQQTNTGNAKDLTDVSTIAKEAMPSIVAITNMGTISYQTFWGVQEEQSESCGSGIIIKQDDEHLYIVTNNHVVKDADELTVQFWDNETVTCEVKGTDEADDLAVVQIDISDIKKDTLDTIKIATIADTEELVVGQGVIAIGNALGYGQSVTNGIISALNRSVTVQDGQTGQVIVNNNMIQTNAAINPGNSGGALLNAQGEVIGINSAKYSDTSVEGFGYAIPMSDAMPIVEQLITREKVDQAKSGYLGIQGKDITADVASAYDMPQGIYIYRVIEDSPAEDVGLRQGDIITGFDGQSVTTMSQLKQLLAYYKEGQKVEIKIQRLGDGYEEKTVKVKLGAMSSAGFDE